MQETLTDIRIDLDHITLHRLTKVSGDYFRVFCESHSKTRYLAVVSISLILYCLIFAS